MKLASESLGKIGSEAPPGEGEKTGGGRERETETETERDRDRQRQREVQRDRDKGRGRVGEKGAGGGGVREGVRKSASKWKRQAGAVRSVYPSLYSAIRVFCLLSESFMRDRSSRLPSDAGDGPAVSDTRKTRTDRLRLIDSD